MSHQATPAALRRKADQGRMQHARIAEADREVSVENAQGDGSFTRGVLIGLAIVAPFWAVVIYAFIWLH